MKKFRKIMAILVAAVMIVTMAVPAWAVTGTLASGDAKGTIIIDNAEDGETYKIYKIFDLYSYVDADTTAHDTTSEHYAYLIEYSTAANSWYSFVYNHSTNNTGITDADQLFTIEDKNPLVKDAKTYYFVTSTFDSSNATPVADEAGRDGSIDSSGTTWSRAQVQTFAKAAADFAKTQNMTATKTALATTTSAQPVGSNITVDNTGASDGNHVKVTFSQLDLGYYLVQSSIGSMVSLDTTNQSVTVKDKNKIPTIDKKVRVRTDTDIKRDDASNIWAAGTRDTVLKDTADYEIGKPITFVTRLTIPFAGDTFETTNNYTYVDVLEHGLSLDLTGAAGTDFTTGSFAIYYGKDKDGSGYAETMTVLDPANYTLNTNPGGNASFSVVFLDTFIDDLEWDAVFEIDYVAYLNATAFVKGDTSGDTADTTLTTIGTTFTHPLEDGPVALSGVTEISPSGNGDYSNTNSGILLYGNASSTNWSRAKVDTYQFDLVKTKEDFNSDGTYDMLAGAVFELYEAKKSNGNLDGDEKTGSALGFTTITTGKVFQIPAKGATADATQLTTLPSDKLTIRGLEKGTYYLKEVTAPDGFHKISNDIKIVIADGASDNTATVTYQGYKGDTNPASNTTAATANWTAGTITGNVYTPSSSVGGVQIINKTNVELTSMPPTM